MIISFLFIMILLSVLFGVGFTVTGAFLITFVWLFIKIPLAIILWGLGLAFCCTIILIPLGIGCFRGGLRLLLPGI